mmetsp:Transcript_14453/g.21726  ORF Transcript_14453/g.21726 Transcript_14453/m.21726 type:complete len:166 (+) Transcript_14453:49-546(+)
MPFARFFKLFKNFKEYNAEVVDTVATLAKFGGLYCFLDSYVLTITTCIGPSMMPTFNHDGDVVLVNKIVRDGYHKGDVVISICNTDPGKTVCKRIAGMPGEKVFFRNSVGFPVFVTVPPGHVWLLGDNASNSNDSRKYGPVPIGLLRGRVAYIVELRFPFVRSVT